LKEIISWGEFKWK